MPKSKSPYTKEEAIRILQRLSERWPKDLWLLATTQSLVLAETGPDGERVMTADGYDQEYLILPLEIPTDAQA